MNKPQYLKKKSESIKVRRRVRNAFNFIVDKVNKGGCLKLLKRGFQDRTLSKYVSMTVLPIREIIKNRIERWRFFLNNRFILLYKVIGQMINEGEGSYKYFVGNTKEKQIKNREVVKSILHKMEEDIHLIEVFEASKALPNQLMSEDVFWQDNPEENFDGDSDCDMDLNEPPPGFCDQCTIGLCEKHTLRF